RFQPDLFRLGQTGYRIEAAATDDSNLRLRHVASRKMRSISKEPAIIQEDRAGSLRQSVANQVSANEIAIYNFRMRFSRFAQLSFLFTLVAAVYAHGQSKESTVPLTIDHNRIVISATLPFPDGSTRKVRAWIDNGNPEMSMSRRLATLLQ